MYNDLYRYIVFCIQKNPTSIVICNQRWIYGIINKIIKIIIIIIIIITIYKIRQNRSHVLADILCMTVFETVYL